MKVEERTEEEETEEETEEWRGFGDWQGGLEMVSDT